ncbi:iron(III) transport system permease protein [Caminicella sporogenes DSM 14501]|uniref:Iron(III) transport system permease protein n=1 Tax=Caminicella sporogenes DSM 14501 TaxID=1121266 RepID=A0A1M6S272_9FIRM|nr:ABC transporter permease subunit [Caminicella sporogenes]RKD27170.1 iron ABC transporter permease [Caminicella sporogenes]SHK38813.1 iron(III) transport system permease protein [Caminicella sporogenes DSM 14501]
MHKVKKEIWIIFIVLSIFFLLFLFIPLVMLFLRSFRIEKGFGFSNYISIIREKEVILAILNSIKISFTTAIITTILAFIMAYTVNCTNISKRVKQILNVGILVPMFFPTITYGFAIIYSFGKQGLLTKFFGKEFIHIYGFKGLLIGYVIYTLPMVFLLINNSFEYIDKRFIIISKLMGDKTIRSFINTVFRPLIGTIGGAFVLSFILSFTDFGIPASVGGTYSVMATYLYQTMIGSIPDFDTGAVLAVLMLFPAGFGIIFLNYLERFNFYYDKIVRTDLPQNRWRNLLLSIFSISIVVCIMSIFVVIFIVPFVKNYPYDMSLNVKFFISTFFSKDVLTVYKNSLFVSAFSAIIGTFISYSAAILNTRTNIKKKLKTSIDIVSMITNAVPGMVLGISYLFFFNKSIFKGTFMIIIVCNTIHFFTTPYLMAKNSFVKMNPVWEITGELMGDTWIKTIVKIIIPNSMSTIVEMISYFFINSMNTISAIIFLVTARTSVITSKIKEFQHYANFNEIFVLSIFIFGTNIMFKIINSILEKKFFVYKKI